MYCTIGKIKSRQRLAQKSSYKFIFFHLWRLHLPKNELSLVLFSWCGALNCQKNFKKNTGIHIYTHFLLWKIKWLKNDISIFVWNNGFGRTVYAKWCVSWQTRKIQDVAECFPSSIATPWKTYTQHAHISPSKGNKAKCVLSKTWTVKMWKNNEIRMQK